MRCAIREFLRKGGVIAGEVRDLINAVKRIHNCVLYEIQPQVSEEEMRYEQIPGITGIRQYVFKDGAVWGRALSNEGELTEFECGKVQEWKGTTVAEQPLPKRKRTTKASASSASSSSSSSASATADAADPLEPPPLTVDSVESAAGAAATEPKRYFKGSAEVKQREESAKDETKGLVKSRDEKKQDSLQRKNKRFSHSPARDSQPKTKRARTTVTAEQRYRDPPPSLVALESRGSSDSA